MTAAQKIKSVRALVDSANDLTELLPVKQVMFIEVEPGKYVDLHRPKKKMDWDDLPDYLSGMASANRDCFIEAIYVNERQFAVLCSKVEQH